MELEGTVTEGGRLVLDDGTTPDVGTRVKLVPVAAQAEVAPPAAPKRGWYWDLVKDLIVDDPDSPGDRAAQHDHYAHGAPKR